MKQNHQRNIVITCIILGILLFGNFTLAQDVKNGIHNIEERKKEFRQLEIQPSHASLYREYKQPEQVLELVHKYIPDTLSWLQQQSPKPIKPLSSSNWEEYAILGKQYETDESLEPTRHHEIILMLQVLDIYENTAKNITIKTKNQKETPRNSKDSEEILSMLPFTHLQIQSIGIDFHAAKTYAETYAWNANKGDSLGQYHEFTEDCTNFVSQILEAGGVQQDVYNNENSGWRHAIVDNRWGGKSHKHSISFIRADTFAKYMGVGYTTTNHRQFSANIQAGDFIAYDRSNDGDWEHIGFVTDKNSYESTYNNRTYYNYKVAQHSTHYHRWVSNPNNGRETLEDNGYRYGRVRR